MITTFHLIYSGDISTSDVSIIQSFLNRIKGPIKFVIAPKTIIIKKQSFTNVHRQFFVNANDILKEYKRICKFSKNDFPIVLTSSNSTEKVEHNSKDVIRISVDDWKDLIGNQFYLPVCYLIVTNIIKTLMNEGIEDINTYTHYSDEGCINQVNGFKSTVIQKLKHSDVCEVCNKRIKELIPDEIESQLFGLLELIQKERIVRKPKEFSNTPVKLALNSEDEIYIPEWNKVIDLQPMEQTIFVFYLNNLNKGVRFKDLKDIKHQKLLIKIYKRFCDKRDYDKITAIIDNVISDKSKAFSSPKSNLNKKLKTIFKGELSNKYIIAGERGKEFKILLSPDMIDQSLNF